MEKIHRNVDYNINKINIFSSYVQETYLITISTICKYIIDNNEYIIVDTFCRS